MPIKPVVSLDFIYLSTQKLLNPVYTAATLPYDCYGPSASLPWDFSYLSVLPIAEATPKNIWVENSINWAETLEHLPLCQPSYAQDAKTVNPLVHPTWAYNHFATKHRLALWAKAIEPEKAPQKKLPKYLTTHNSDPSVAKNARPLNLLADRYCFAPLQQLLGETKFTVINQNLMDLMPKKHFDGLIKKALRLFPFLKLNRIAARLVAALFMLLKCKEAYPLLVFLKFLFQDVHYSKHKPYYRFVNYLVLFIIGPRLHSFQCLGAQITFKGKLAVGGNSRKAVQRTSTGMISSSSKFIKISRHSSAIRTKTGAVGFSVLIAW